MPIVLDDTFIDLADYRIFYEGMTLYLIPHACPKWNIKLYYLTVEFYLGSITFVIYNRNSCKFKMSAHKLQGSYKPLFNIFA